MRGLHIYLTVTMVALIAFFAVAVACGDDTPRKAKVEPTPMVLQNDAERKAWVYLMNGCEHHLLGRCLLHADRSVRAFRERVKPWEGSEDD